MKTLVARFALIAAVLFGLSARAEQVHVVQQTLVNGVSTQLSDQILETGSTYSTQSAPTKSGYIFTHWSSNQSEQIVNRDRHGRAKEVASYKVYAEMILSANYLPASQDKDADGLADGYEIYWYGTTDILPTSDTDGDGYTFAEEIAAGTNPLLAEDSTFGAVVWDEGETLQYNPENLAPYVIRSEPEGKLFATQSDYAKPGTVKPSPSVSKASGFAYWTLNGVRQADRHGRAKDSVSFTMTGEPIELIAVCIDNSTERELAYWYGPESGIAADSDTDNDGYTFAEEIAAGTNPILAEDSTFGAVVWDDGELVEYNPEALLPYIIRSEPEGKLFATQSATVKVDTLVTAPSVSKANGFAYWTLNGERLADRLGRAKDSVSFTMPKGEVELIAVAIDNPTERELAYWYGPNSGLNSDSDTDGDGYTFAEEIAAGTNPILAEDSTFGAVVWDDGETLEVNLQPFDQWQGAIIDNEYKQLFVSNWKKNDSVDFGAAVMPIIVDLNDDGLFDLVIILEDGRKIVYLNVGSSGNPEFKEVPWDDAWLAKLEATKVDVGSLTLDTPIINGLSYAMADVDKDGIVDLLASDSDGRIWFYKGFKTGEEVRYVLQHKVWGGSFPGFAAGLMIAAVDWDDDGDIDLVCGTEDGKLMLLSDPRVGRPTNVRAEAGATDVVLRWDANVNSRVRGYGIYRGASQESFDKIQNLWPITQYRDQPSELKDYYYRVTGKSRFYTAGNSTPVESESIPTDAVFVRFTPELWLNDTSSYTDDDVEVIVSVNNSVGIATEGFELGFDYDAAVLEPIEVIADGLSADMAFASNAQNGKWTISATSGEMKKGSGILLKLKFHVKAIKNPSPTEVVLTSAALKSSLGQPISISLPKKAVITLAERHYDPAIVTVGLEGKKIDTKTNFILSVNVISTEELVDFSAEVDCDIAALEFKGWTGSIKERNLALEFYAKDQHTIDSTTVVLKAIKAVDIHENEITVDDVQAVLLIHDTNPPIPAIVSLSTEGQKVDTLTKFTVTFALTTDKPLKSGKFVVEYDNTIFEHEGSNGRIEVSSTKSFSLDFFAKDQHTITSSDIRMIEARVVDANDFTIDPSDPVVSTILIHDAHPLIPAKVSMTISDMTVNTEEDFEVMLNVTSTEELKSLEMAIDYNKSLMTLLSGELKFSSGVPSSITYRFHALENHTVDKSTITITPTAAIDHNNLVAELPDSVKGNVIFVDSNPWKPAVVSLSMKGAKVDTRSDLSLPVTVTSSETLTDLSFAVDYDEAILEYHGANPVVFSGSVPTTFNLNFTAKDNHTVTKTSVTLKNIAAHDIHDLDAEPIDNAYAEIVIHDAYPLIPAKVSMTLSDMTVNTEEDFEVMLNVTSTEELKSLEMAIDYNKSLMTLLSGELKFSSGVPSSITYRFHALENHTIDKSTIVITPKSAIDHNDLVAELPESVKGNVIFVDSNPWKPAVVSISMKGAKVDTRSDFSLPVIVTSSETLTQLSLTVEYDAAILEYHGANPVVFSGNVPPTFDLNFTAKDNHTVAKTVVTLKSIAAHDIHDFDAEPIDDTSADIVIHDAYPLIPAKVSMTLSDVTVNTEEDFEVSLNITSTESLKTLELGIDYNQSLMTLLSGELTFTSDVPSSITYRFHALENHTIDKSTITITPTAAIDHNNLVAELPDSVKGNVIFIDSNPWKPAVVSFSMKGAKVDTRSDFCLPVTVTSSETLTDLSFAVEYDEAILEYHGTNPVVFSGNVPTTLNLNFTAKDNHTVTKTSVTLKNIAAHDIHGFDAEPIDNASAEIVIHDAYPLVPAGVVVNVTDTHPETISTFEVPIRITSTKTLKDFSAKVNYDASIFEFKRAEGVSWDNGTITATGNVPNIIKLTFFAKDQHAVMKSEISLSNLSAHCTDNLDATITATKGTVYITDSNVPVAPVVTAGLYHVQVKSGGEFSVPFGLTSVGNLAEATLEIEWDTELITYAGSSKLTFKCEGEYNQLQLSGFKMTAIEGLQATSWVKIKSLSAVGANGLAATIKSINPDTAQVMVSREIGKYCPGDLDGDGKLTDMDTIILTGYSAYLKAPTALMKNAIVKSYQNQYHVNIALTGDAAKAADVNCDGKVDASDISLLAMLVEEAKGIGQ